MNPETLEQAFRKGFGVFWNKGTVENFYDFFDDRALMVDEDTPFLLEKPAFKEHVDFHLSGIWDKLEWIPRDPKFVVVGSTGIVNTYFTLRGKPKDAGFRLRHGIVTIVCSYDAAASQWRAASMLLDPLLGHIENASPT